MTKLVEGVLTVVSGLSRKERQLFFQGFLDSGMLDDDQRDRMVIESRRRDPTRPLADFVTEMKRKRRLR